MALNRLPTSIQVNGVALLVRGGSADGLFSQWQRIPGLANFTLPDETGSTNETQLQDGAISFAQIAGVGTITGSIGAITGHAAHRFLAGKRRTGDEITITILRPAGSNVEVPNTDNAVAAEAAAAGKAKWTVDAGAQNSVKAALKEGTLVAAGATAPAFGDFASVFRVNADGDFFETEPGPAAAVAKASGVDLYTRRPGIIYANVACSVNGFGDGDFQAGGAIAANVSFAPSEALPAQQVWFKDVTETAADATYGSVFTDIA